MLRNTFLMPTENLAQESVPNIAPAKPSLDPNSVELPVDVMVSGDSLIVRTPIVAAGINDISVSLLDTELTITKSGRIEEDPNTTYYIQECYWDRLSRTINLPQPVDPTKTKASLNDGILTVTLPLLHKPSGKIIRVK